MGLKVMSYLFADSNTTQHCSLAVAKGEIPFLGPKIAVSGL